MYDFANEGFLRRNVQLALRDDPDIEALFRVAIAAATTRCGQVGLAIPGPAADQQPWRLRHRLRSRVAYGPTPDELVNWMSDPEEIDRRLKGTEHAHLIDPKAHQQRAGVLGSLGLVADSLRLLPKRSETDGAWTATEWAKKRQGWVFLTSLPAEREALRPLQSLWIDWLVLRLLNEPTVDQKRVWFVIDEREYVKRFYDPSRGDVILNPLDKRCPYWGPAEELRTRSEAKALSVSLFQPPQDRKGEFFIESPQKIFAFLMQIEPLVMESEISGLADLHAYMNYQNYVTRFSFPYFDMPEVAKGFELRHRPDDKLPYCPNRARSGETELPSSELKQTPERAASPQGQEVPRTPQMQQDTVVDTELLEPQNLILRG